MTLLERLTSTKRAASRLAPHAPRLRLRHLAVALVVSLSGLSAQAQTGGPLACVIASNDGRNGFRTDEISGCRIDPSTGNASFVYRQQNRTRSYAGTEPLTTRHLDIASYWLSRTGQMPMPASTNPAGFDLQGFLREAAQATHGFVLVRNKRNGGRALNVVYITNGVYRSIDFPGTNLKETPAGFLTTRR